MPPSRASRVWVRECWFGAVRDRGRVSDLDQNLTVQATDSLKATLGDAQVDVALGKVFDVAGIVVEENATLTTTGNGKIETTTIDINEFYLDGSASLEHNAGLLTTSGLVTIGRRGRLGIGSGANTRFDSLELYFTQLSVEFEVGENVVVMYEFRKDATFGTITLHDDVVLKVGALVVSGLYEPTFGSGSIVVTH